VERLTYVILFLFCLIFIVLQYDYDTDVEFRSVRHVLVLYINTNAHVVKLFPRVCICLNFCGIRVCLVNSYQLSHTLLLYLVFYMPYQRGVDFCLPSLGIRSMPFLGASSDLVTRLATLQCRI